MLKNRLAIIDKDIDGNKGEEIDVVDISALKNILLYGGTMAQVAVSDTTNGYNEVTGLDITDLVHLSK